MVQKSCRQCITGFEITEDDLKFYDKVSPVFNGKKYQIPPPTICPECRQQRRLAFRNEQKLYNNTCHLCHKNIISLYSPESTFQIYCQECWWSDKWNAKQYGQETDWKMSFFQQFQKLQQSVPRISLFNHNSLNSAYNNYVADLKDCYLTFGGIRNEDCYYGNTYIDCKNCADGLYTLNSQLCYQTIDCNTCYHVFWAQDCDNCHDCWFLFDCKNCRSCIGCYNLRNKEYCFFNQQLSREEWTKKYESLLLSYRQLESAGELFRRKVHEKAIYKYCHGEQNENVHGDFIYHSKNIFSSFNIYDSEDIQYAEKSLRQKNTQDVYGTSLGELSYETMYNDYNYHTGFCTVAEHLSESWYCDACFNSSYLFGCIGLNSSQYCILNKQYTKEEYETLVPKIIEHMMKTPLTPPLTRGDTGGCEWGEFFDPKLSPFGYNETVAQEYFPLTKEEALKKGFNWSDYVPPPPQVEKIIPASKLPDHIKDVPDDIPNWAIECEVTKKPFKIIKPELKFYREHNLPIPRRHPDQRHRDRMALRNPRKLWTRQCDCRNEEHHHAVEAHCNAPLRDMNNVQQSNIHRCPHTFQTTYSPERKEIVYCEACYLKEVY